MDTDNKKEKKKITLKEIGPAKLIMLLLAGILLLVSFPNVLPTKSTPKTSSANKAKETASQKIADSVESEEDIDTYTKTLEERLKTVLTKVEGIGSVDVMITLKGSKELVILKDTPFTQESMNEDDGEGGSRVSSSTSKEDSTVLVNNGNGESKPYVVKELEPEVEGIVVIAQGGDNGNIKTEIIEAVQVLFDVPAHKIKVMTMNH